MHLGTLKVGNHVDILVHMPDRRLDHSCAAGPTLLGLASCNVCTRAL